MRYHWITGLGLLLLIGCEGSGPPPPPVDPVPTSVTIPNGMPNDTWFHDNVLKSEVPVLVDFSATWCGPCRQMKPEIHKIELAYQGRLKVVEVDVDEHPYLSEFFDISGIPHLMVIKDGKIEASDVGGRGYDALVSFVKPTVGGP